MSRMSVRGLAVVSATAVTAVGSVAGAASASSTHDGGAPTPAAGASLLQDIPVGRQAQVQTATVTQQAEAMAVQADVSARKTAEQTARAAAARAAEAKQAEAKKRAAAKAAAGDPSASFPVQSSYTVAQLKAIAAQIVGSGQFQCFSNIVDHESTWNYLAVNASSGAYGLVQALPGSKMASVAADWRTNPATQIKWGLNYMNTTYGSPCQAWAFWQVHHAY
ncbi:transglycosylase SLT domain-containing protein [Streptomyces sp. NPDC127079]|uniref:aggregation-promoting factor C-terminal-like domain-containing protein n=1 Tax=Streptomyces sp. NPDC127079 TaxID=3347132 RepID=UPI003665EBE9